MSNQVNQLFNIQTGTHQQSSSTQHRYNSHGDSSEVTDQTSSQWTPYPLPGHPYHHGNQQQLQNGAPSLVNPQPNAVPHHHIPPSDRTLPLPQTLSCPSDGIQTSIQQPQESYSLSADSQFTPNPPERFRTAYQPSSPQSLPHEPTNQTNMYTWHSTQGMIHSGSSENSLKKTVASQPASPFSETAEQISSQPRLFLHRQASQLISQSGALQQPSSTQHHGMSHGDSSVVTDQVYSPYPHRVLPQRPHLHRTNQQLLWRRPISYPQVMPNSWPHALPSNEAGQPHSLIQHPDFSSNLTTGQYFRGTPHPHQNQLPLHRNLHQVLPYRPNPHQTNQQPTTYPLFHPQPAPYQGVTSQPISPHHPGYSDSPALNTQYHHPRYHHQQHGGHHLREHSQMYSLHYTCNTSSITHLGRPPPPVKQYFPIQSGYARVDSPSQKSLMNQFTSDQSSADLASVEPTKPHSPSTSQPTTLSANRTDSSVSSSSMSLDTPDPKRPHLSPHSSTTPRVLEVGLPEPCVTSLSTVASSYISCDNSSVVNLPSSSQKHSSNKHLDVSPSNPSPPKPTFNIVYDRLYQISSKWHNLGLALDLHESTLNRIECNNSACEDRLRETLAVRISDKPLTWKDVIRALRSVTVNNSELATTIELEYSDQLDVPILIDSQEQSFQNTTSTALSLSDCVLRYASYLKDKYKRMPVLPDSWPPPLAGQGHFTNLALIERRKYHILPQAKTKDSIEYDYAYGNVDNIVEKKQPIKLEDLFEPLPGEDSTQNQFIILMDGAPGVGKTTISRKICIDWSKDKLKSNFHFVILLPLREVLIDSESGSNISIADLLPADDPELKDQIVKYVQKTSGAGILFIFDGFDELSSYQRTKHSLFLDIVKGKRLHKCSVLVTSRTYASGPLEVISRIDRHVEVLGFTKQQINGCIKRNISEKDKAKQLLEMLKERLDIISLCYIPLNCRIVLYVYQQQYTLPDTLTELYEVFILYTIKHYAEKISSAEEIEDQIKQANSIESLPPVVIEQLHFLLETAYSGMTEDKLVFEFKEIRQTESSLNFGLLNKIDIFMNDRNKHYYQFLHFTIQEYLAATYLSLQKIFTIEDKLKFLRLNVSEDRYRITLLFLAGLTGLNFIPARDVFPSEPLIDLTQPENALSERKAVKLQRTKFLFFAQLLYESRKKACEWLLSCLKNKVFDFRYHKLSQFDCLVLANFFSVTPEDHVWESIDISNCSLKANHLEFLLCKLHSKTNAPIFSSTRALYLVRPRIVFRDNPTPNISFSWLLPLISGCSKVERICVPQFSQSQKSRCQLSPILNDVFAFKSFHVCKGNGCVTDAKLDLMRMSLYICPKLLSILFKHLNPKEETKIDLRDHPEVFQDCSSCDTFSSVIWKSLYGTLDTFENLQELAITPLNTEHAFSLMNTFSGTKLVIDFSDNLIRPEELINLRNHLSRDPMTSIWFKGLKLSLENNATFTIEIDSAIGDSQHCLGYLRTLLEEKLPPNVININVTCSFLTEDMGKWLGANSDLKELTVNLRYECVKSLSDKFLSDEFFSALAQYVSHSATLEVLKIENCELTYNQLETISNSLPHTSSLKELHFLFIPYPSNWSALFQAVQRNTSLCKLDCNTTTYSLYSESCRALCDMITNNAVLQELSISAQSIGGEYEMFVNTLLQSTTTRQVTVGRYERSEIDSFKERLSKYMRDKVTSTNCWTLGSVTLNFKSIQ